MSGPGRPPCDALCMMRAFLGALVLIETDSPTDVHRLLHSNPTFARACGFRGRDAPREPGELTSKQLPQESTLREFNELDFETSADVIADVFGTWNRAKEAAGLRTFQRGTVREIDESYFERIDTPATARLRPPLIREIRVAPGALAALATTLSGVAEDIVVYANKGLVEVDDDYASTSSIMPQKKNPDSMELVRATAGHASSGLNGLLTTLKGLPRAYNRDLQRAHPHAFEVVDAVTEATEVAAGAVATADWPAERLEAAAAEGFSTATGVADLLAMAGLPFRTAHEIVAGAAEAADGDADYEAVEEAAEAVLDEPLSSYVSRERVEAALDPVESVAMRDSYGGPAPDAVADAVERRAAAYEEDQAAHGERADALDDARERLSEVVHDYA